MSAIPQTITPNPYTTLFNVYIQIANKMGFQQQKKFGGPGKGIGSLKAAAKQRH
jgi:hypothetical protein